MTVDKRQAVDPDGRRVVLDWRVEAHLRRRRPRMLEHMEAILETVARPDIHEEDLVPGRERYIRLDLDLGRALRVVVDFNESPGFVVTAFVQFWDPENQR